MIATHTAYLDARLRTLHSAGDQMRITPQWAAQVYGTLDEAQRALAERHHSFRVHRMADDSLLLTKRACISRNRWL